jgi:uncharacterized Zn-binding protein involved in type VI secretion
LGTWELGISYCRVTASSRLSNTLVTVVQAARSAASSDMSRAACPTPSNPPCCPTVLTGSLPQARVGDQAICVGPLDVIVLGSFTVFVGGQPAARIGDVTAHGGVIITGLPTVLIG